jgi:hypothetical protein
MGTWWSTTPVTSRLANEMTYRDVLGCVQGCMKRSEVGVVRSGDA